LAWTIEYTELARKNLKKLDPSIAQRINRYMVDHVGNLADPRSVGKPLRGPQSNRWRYRVADYRIICRILDAQVVILVIELGHRRDVYRD
jgi:mRNA interferase RelE/StbE